MEWKRNEVKIALLSFLLSSASASASLSLASHSRIDGADINFEQTNKKDQPDRARPKRIQNAPLRAVPVLHYTVSLFPSFRLSIPPSVLPSF
jgi:hypothetical protein